MMLSLWQLALHAFASPAVISAVIIAAMLLAARVLARPGRAGTSGSAPAAASRITAREGFAPAPPKLRDPDAPGKPRPRAPSAATAAA
jgi:hypothetical protein